MPHDDRCFGRLTILLFTTWTGGGVRLAAIIYSCVYMQPHRRRRWLLVRHYLWPPTAIYCLRDFCQRAPGGTQA